MKYWFASNCLPPRTLSLDLVLHSTFQGNPNNQQRLNSAGIVWGGGKTYWGHYKFRWN